MAADFDGVLVDKFGFAHNAALGRPGFDVFEYEADETVALGFDPRHHFAAVGTHAGGIEMDAERSGVQGVVAGFGGGDQQFGGHAADAGAGGAENGALNQINVVGELAGVAEGAHAGGAAADNQYVCLDLFYHALFSFCEKATAVYGGVGLKLTSYSGSLPAKGKLPE